ncbi:hypothetical protein MBLNU459_g1767t1 [Dothideomycetes sp. NU459]
MDGPSARPRAHSRAWSHKSDKSQGSKKETLTESPADKKRRDSLWKGTGSKANPNSAINEAQPGDIAVTEKVTIDSLRSVQHKDSQGNPISEPDLSNPTRPRWERPLDTIRSFERAIDGGYKRRSMSRSESYDIREQMQNRRSSYYGGGHDGGRYEAGPSPSRAAQYNGGYYGTGARRPDGYFDNGASPMAPPSRNRFQQRLNPGSPSYSRSNSAFGMHSQVGYNDPYESGVGNGNISDSTGPWANSTDPSSENSSIDKAHAAAVAAAAKPAHVSHHMDNYAYDGYNGAPIMEEYASDSDGAYGSSVPRTLRNGHNGGAPAIPSHSQAPPVRAPIKLGGGDASMLSSQGGSLPSTARVAPAKEEKKKGFFKKRFSKS